VSARTVVQGPILSLLICLILAASSSAAEAPPAPTPAPEQVTPDKVSKEDWEKKKKEINGSDTAWLLTATGLVLFMVPGLALFYGGMVRRKNILGTLMHSMVALGVVGVQWVLIGYCLAFGASQRGLIGWDPKLIGLWGIMPSDRFAGGTHIPIFVHCMYQGMFAIITPALISGAIAERVKFGPYCLFLVLWATLVYDPLAHWVWGASEKPVAWMEGDKAVGDVRTEATGWLGGKMGAIDFAGGTVVHISAGFAALASILVLRKRRGYPEHAMHPNSMVLTLTGAGILWFGWFGFNGGSALGSNSLAGMALAASQVAAAAAAITWMFAEWVHKGKPTALGFASGLVAGLVAITPASGFVSPASALAIGILAGLVCYSMVCLKPALKYDDSLDAFGVHGVGGFLGAVLTGVFGSYVLWNDANGFSEATGGLESLGAMTKPGFSFAQLGAQLTAAITAAAYAFCATWVLVKIIDKVWGFNLDAQAENEGLDQSQHGEVGFDLSPAMEMAPAGETAEPRAADVPPNGRRHFTVLVEGASPDELMHAWSALCQPGPKPPPQELKAIYPYMTTVKGNRFQFRGGDPADMRMHLQRLFQDSLDGTPIQTHVEA
jgi:ammonium transporter